ncbi:hypothetical protein ILUMI_25130 [Ignelater luminosus]|uniref:Uncharacterized protein n=1 Tax=Ignelater luminosus TaxID=2038154 RepID=A0A8K0C948_IGNLU|nr:hypothetical protein ILUMI_25130 [Ignelater luminosus]
MKLFLNQNQTLKMICPWNVCRKKLCMAKMVTNDIFDLMTKLQGQNERSKTNLLPSEISGTSILKPVKVVIYRPNMLQWTSNF